MIFGKLIDCVIITNDLHVKDPSIRDGNDIFILFIINKYRVS